MAALKTAASPSFETPPFSPHLALVSGIMAVSTGAIFARLADAPPMVIAAYRVGLATVFLTPMVWFKTRSEIFSLTRNELIRAMGAGLFLALHFATWISSLSYTSVANSVVLVNTNPLWVALLSPWVTGERIRPAVKLSIALSVAGGILIGSSDLTAGGQALIGDGLALIGGLCTAFYLLLGRSLRQKLSLLAYIYVCYGSAAVVLWGCVLGLQLPLSGFAPGTYAAFLAMALISQLIGHSSYNWALKWYSAGTIAVSLLGEPVGATLLAYILFGETLTAMKLLGGGLILAAIYLAAVNERRA